jgi:hypothetical protein
MRTNEPRVIPSFRLLGCLSAAGVIGVALAACSSSTHLDPPSGSATGSGGGSATTTTSATTSSGAGGTGGNVQTMACKSNPECSTFPNTVCDTVSGECHECLVDSDCTLKGGPVCAAGKCGCPTKGETFCGAPAVGHCTDKMTAQADCGACGHACFGACAAGACADPWEPTSLVGAPDARSHHVAVWDATDKTMIVWGGRTASGSAATGGVYDPAKNTWKSTSLANAPTARVDATAVWDDTEKAMIVWGGRASLGGGPALATGALYYPAKNVWKTIAIDANTPAGRWGQSAVWTGSKMLVWGGENSTGQLGDGGTFDPAVGGGWTPIAPAVGSASPRTLHTAVWTGVTTNSMLVWGGYGPDPMNAPTYFADGAVYDIMGAAWGPMNAGMLAPSPRSQATAVWTGLNMLVWGGTDGGTYLGDGSKYASGAWFTISNNGPPAPRAGHSAAWMTTSLGARMIVWGGQNSGGYLNSGALLDEVSLGWSPALPTAPIARAHHSTVINGDLGAKMIIWGGDVGAVNSGEVTSTGAIFDASAPM